MAYECRRCWIGAVVPVLKPRMCLARLLGPWFCLIGCNIKLQGVATHEHITRVNILCDLTKLI
jgi:hypothetical protein